MDVLNPSSHTGCRAKRRRRVSQRRRAEDQIGTVHWTMIRSALAAVAECTSTPLLL